MAKGGSFEVSNQFERRWKYCLWMVFQTNFSKVLGDCQTERLIMNLGSSETLMPVVPSPSPSVSRQTKPGERSARRLIPSNAPVNSAKRSLSMSSTATPTFGLRQEGTFGLYHRDLQLAALE